MGLISNKLFASVFGRAGEKKEDLSKPVSESTERFMGPDFARLRDFSAKSKAALLQIPHETLSVVSKDNLTLVGYLYRNTAVTAKTVICVHGYHSDGIADFASVALEYLKRGFNVLLVNNRASGPSQGDFASFGVLEREDSKLWVDLISRMFNGGNIILQGCSMGAATVCMMADMDLPENVRLIVSDCSFADIGDQFRYTLANLMRVPVWPAFNMLNSEFKKHFGCDFEEYSPLKSVAHAKTAVFFVHGKLDRYVPVENAQKLYDACSSDKHLLIVDKAGHAAAHMYGAPGYYDEILAFAAKYMD